MCAENPQGVAGRRRGEPAPENAPTLQGRQPAAALFRDVTETLRADSAQAKDVLHLLIEQGLINRTKDDLFFYAEAIDDLKKRLVKFLEQNGDDPFPVQGNDRRRVPQVPHPALGVFRREERHPQGGGRAQTAQRVGNWASNEVDHFLLWERHLAAMIVAGSHSHKDDTSLPAGWRSAP